MSPTTKRRLRVLGVVVIVSAVLTGFFRERLTDAFVRREIRSSLLKMDPPIDLGHGMHVLLCGTGTPQSNEHRAPPCLAIVAGDQYLVFDAGEGTATRLDNLGLPVAQIDAAFITHWHSDHFAGLGYLTNDSWVQGRRTPLPVFGPRGVGQVIEGLSQVYALDAHYRVESRADALDPRLRDGVPRPIADRPDPNEAVYAEAGVRVTAFATDHRPVDPALGYRVEYQGHVVVISGDTRVVESVADAARGADLLVHEALNRDLLERAITEAAGAGLAERAEHMRRIVDYHADSVELAKLAESVGVKRLVLTHLIPPSPPNALGDWLFTRGMRDHFGGELVVGRDGMIVTLR